MTIKKADQIKIWPASKVLFNGVSFAGITIRHELMVN